MKCRRRALRLAFLVGCSLSCFASSEKPISPVAAGKRGRPTKATAEMMHLLQANCLACHNPEKHKAGLQLVSRASMLKGSESGAVVAPGKPDKSLLLKVLLPDSDPHMPPKRQLATNQIELVRKWIAGGAPWDAAALARAQAPRVVKFGALPSGYQPVLAMALSPDGTRLAVGRANRLLIHNLSATNFPVLAETEAHQDLVRSLSWSPDGRRLASGSYRDLKVWEAETLRIVWEVSSNLIGQISALRYSPFGGALVAADSAAAQSGWVRLFAADTGILMMAWQAHSDTVYDMAISADGGLLATGSGDKLVKLWELISQKETTQLEGHVGAVLGLSFNPGSTELVTIGADKQLKVWDVKTRESVVTIGGRKHSLNAVAWSENGRMVIAGDEDGRLYSFTDFKRHTGEQSSSTANERQIGQWPGPLHAVALDADGSRVIAAGQDGIVYVLDGQGKLLGQLEPRSDPGLPPSGVASLAQNEKREAPLPFQKKAGAGSKKADKKRATEPDRATDAAVLSPTEIPSFVHDVLPMLAKAGCSAGSCHAKAEGQNGFKLSVFNYDPKSDYKQIVKQNRGRRIFPAAAEESLILLKPTLAIEHGGGQRFEVGSQTYRTLVRWIRGGMPYQHTNEPSLVRIRVEPPERSYRKGTSQPLRVEAQYSDGSVRDVTSLADFAASEKEIVKVDDDGVMHLGNLSGEAVVVARFMGLVEVARATVPAEHTLPAERYASLRVNGFIDELAYAQFRKLGLFPSETCSDAEFLRRSSLDTIGLLPTAAEARTFLSSTDADKRRRWIDHLLAHPAYADYWANKWADLLRPNPDRVGVKSVFMLDQWLRESFRANKPYDQLVREMILAEGSNHRYGPVVIYRDRREPTELTTLFSQVFLGVRMECAKCHHHPNEKWSQNDFYQFAAFFGALKQKGAGLSPPISAGTETFYFAPGGNVKHPVSEEVMKPCLPGGAPANLPEAVDPRRALADWLSDPQNPFFAKAAINRVWASLFGRGFVEPVDDFRVSNPAANEPLLNALAEDFIGHGYDLKHLLRAILESQLYQLSSTPNEFNLADTRNFSRSYRRRLPAEVLLDAVSDVTGVPEAFNGCPPGTRAVQTWSYKIPSHFMDSFGRPNPSTDCPCERDLRPSVVQSLHMMNSKDLQSKLAGADGRVRQLADSKLAPDQIVTELYLAAFSRAPAAPELNAARAAYQAPAATRWTATEDVLWALLNSAEFVFNH